MAPLRPDHEHSLAPASRQLLSAVAARSWSDGFYLAGSAALALWIDHRPVRDLDLMTATNRLAGSDRRDLLQDLLSIDQELRVETARDGYLYVRAGSGAALRLYHYPYPLIDPEGETGGLAVASPVDLGLMKLGAIISRGTRRDFVDLYLLCRRLPLPGLLARSGEKFGHVRDFPLQALKGLADLSLITGEPMPRLAAPLSWETVAGWLEQQVLELGRRQVGLG